MNTPRRHPLFAQLAAALALLAGLGGCLERRLLITSDPPGAAVSINDVDLGRTPVEADFTFYGGYDVLVRMDGFEPIRERRDIPTPIYEYPPIDLAASALPVRIEKVVKWHYVLAPAMETAMPKEEAALIERARAARERLNKD
jgi:hypothetical protein